MHGTEQVRVRLDLAYDGTDFAGWAVQAEGQRTVQGELERALAVVTARSGGPPPRLVVAGRTDAGVHATGQVAHVDLGPRQLAALTRRHRDDGDAASIADRVNGLLGAAGDVAVRRSALAPDGFDARFSAVFRRYSYRIVDGPGAVDPLQRRRTLRAHRGLDEGLMQQAAAFVVGLHDFAAFCRPRPGATTVRELHHLSWQRESDGVLVADVRADAFCHGMVRALVGASIEVGAGRLAPGRVGELLLAAGRSGEFVVAPAHGLTLVEVGYPPDAGLADQAARARARRELDPR